VAKKAEMVVSAIRKTFTPCSLLRRVWMSMVCRAAVAMSHGMREAFSTGSHAQ